MKTYEKFDGKRILIWGYGREGRSTEKFLKEFCRPSGVEVFEGKKEDIRQSDYDYIIKSPGIIMDDDDPKYTSQTDILLEVYKKNIIGVTGTKGKSTTSAMLHHVLSECLDTNVILLGNIGKPCLDYFGDIEDDTVVVFEMSCHQLAHAHYSPHISVFLNIYEEHLDYYHTFDNYFRAKCNITKNQGPEDHLFIGDQVPAIDTEACVHVIKRDETPHFELGVPGKHNEYNAYVVSTIASDMFGLDDEDIRKALKTFKGLPHRLCYIGERDGIKYYDDSISTIPNATIEALGAIDDAKTVIIGGLDRGISYDILIDYIRQHNGYNYIFAYESGKKIYEAVKGPDNCILVEDLSSAVKTAKEVTPEGCSCILSPAAASYGYFKDFEERGDKFREYVFG